MNHGANPQISAWTGEFGDDYVERNQPTDEHLAARTRMWATILQAFDGAPPRSILEVGSNVGNNLRALRRVTHAELFAVEPNDKARDRLVADAVVPQTHAFAAAGDAIPRPDASVDLVFTSGVLIHIHPDGLAAVIDDMHRVAKRYIVCSEYFADKPEIIPYRGQNDLLFKRDFGGLWLDRHPGLETLDYGFFWKRLSGLDNATWWAFRKT